MTYRAAGSAIRGILPALVLVGAVAIADEFKGPCPEETPFNECPDAKAAGPGIVRLESWPHIANPFEVDRCCANSPVRTAAEWAAHMGMPGDGFTEYSQAHDVDHAIYWRYDVWDECFKFDVTQNVADQVYREWIWATGQVNLTTPGTYKIEPKYKNHWLSTPACYVTTDPPVYGPQREILVNEGSISCQPLEAMGGLPDVEEPFDEFYEDIWSLDAGWYNDVGGRARTGVPAVVDSVGGPNCSGAAGGFLTPNEGDVTLMQSQTIRLGPLIVGMGLGDGEPIYQSPWCSASSCKFSKGYLFQKAYHLESWWTRYYWHNEVWYTGNPSTNHNEYVGPIWSDVHQARCCWAPFTISQYTPGG
ncbi:MAG: hypothetical protein KF858_14760 [Candidatus Sumerlaeia bacterium]|nr:hypothetical protein [Candidatus Sumerlaeia bacterium]